MEGSHVPFIPTPTAPQEPILVKPNIMGRIAMWLRNIFVYALLAFFASIGVMALLQKVYGRVKDSGIWLVFVVILGLLLLIGLVFALTLPRRYTISKDSVIAKNLFGTKKYSLEDNKVSAESITYTYSFIPIMTSRKLLIVPRDLTAKPKTKKIAVRGFTKKHFNMLLNTLQGFENQRNDIVWQEKLAAAPTTASASTIVRDSSSNDIEDVSLDKTATYAIVNKPEDMKVKTPLISIICLGLLFLLTFSFIFVSEGALWSIIITILFFAAFIALLIARIRNKTPKGTILGAEITPQALNLHVDGQLLNFPWDKINQMIVSTPGVVITGIYNNPNRTVSVNTPAGHYNYSFGQKMNPNPNTNYEWFVNYCRLHLDNRLTYEFE